MKIDFLSFCEHNNVDVTIVKEKVLQIFGVDVVLVVSERVGVRCFFPVICVLLTVLQLSLVTTEPTPFTPKSILSISGRTVISTLFNKISPRRSTRNLVSSCNVYIKYCSIFVRVILKQGFN